MKTEVAKNLLEDKTCDTCWHKLVSNYPGKCVDPKTKKHRPLPKNNTCENWERSGFSRDYEQWK